jgi:hypothetical protein
MEMLSFTEQFDVVVVGAGTLVVRRRWLRRAWFAAIFTLNL